jgi:hypothetical protein
MAGSAGLPRLASTPGLSQGLARISSEEGGGGCLRRRLLWRRLNSRGALPELTARENQNSFRVEEMVQEKAQVAAMLAGEDHVLFWISAWGVG